MRTRAQIEKKRAELEERRIDPKVKHGALITLGSAIDALDWVLGDEVMWM